MTRLLLLAMAIMPTFTNALSAAEPNSTSDWHQWRGPNRTGVITEAAWPTKVSGETVSEQWRVTLGSSYSGPIVDQDRVYVTETVDKKFESVSALDRKTGEEIWSNQWEGSMTVPFFAAANGSWIRSTPALADGHLYVAGMRDVVVCIEAGSGDQVWRTDFPKQLGTPVPSFGFVASPLVHAGGVYVQAGGGLTKLNAKSGEIIWQTAKDGGGMSGGAFSSPIIATIAGNEQLVVQTRTRLAGIDLQSGEELWGTDIPAFRGMNILTPTIIGDAVFTSSYGGGSFLFDIKGGDAWTVTERWSNKREGYMSSPVVVGGNIYLHMKNQRFTCIDAATGEERWATKPFGKYWSMVASGNKIMALDERGDLLLINASPEKFDLIDKRHISDSPTWAHLALIGDELFVRELEAQVAYRWK